MDLRVILAGQRSFGAAAYEAINVAGHDVCAVWSPPSGAIGAPRDKLTELAKRDHLWECVARRVPQVVREHQADLFVAAHSHDFIGRDSRAATRLGGIGYHPSLLPRHRGRDAVRWTVHMGDPIAGGSVYWLTDNVDGGPIAAQDWCFTSRPSGAGPYDADDCVSELWRAQLFPMGIRLLLKVLDDLERGVIVEVPQEEWAATWEPSWNRPPLHRPELPQIGKGINGFRHVVTKEGAL